MTTPASDIDSSISSLTSALAERIDGEVRADEYTRHLYASDASMYAIEPLVVTFPRHEEDVRAVIAVARERSVPILARGAGTSLAGQTVGRAVVLDFSRHMNCILEIDEDTRTAKVQPGVVQDQLNNAVRSRGLMFGPDTSTSNRATIGGMIGNNSSGSHSIRYGSTIEHVESVRVVLADGTAATVEPTPLGTQTDGSLGRIARDIEAILRARQEAIGKFRPYWRNSGGYRIDRVFTNGVLDLTKLIVGSAGTLAVVTEAVVKLVPRPKHSVIAVGHFTSTSSAIAATGDALTLDPASVELLDRRILDLSRQKGEFAELGSTLVGDPDALLFVEFAGDEADDLDAQAHQLVALWSEHRHGYHTLIASSAQEQAALLKVRGSALGLLMAASEGSRRPLAFVEDTAVPPDVLVPYVQEFEAVLARHGMEAGIYGHCSVGCLHIRPFLDLQVPHDVAAMEAVADEISKLVVRYGGVNSSEHGDGLARSGFNEQIFGPELYQALREVKAAFDPDGVLNPGKIVDAPAMTEHLRDRDRPRPASLNTRLAFAEPSGMLGAADRCMNIGTCRKVGVGVMCPSYMATGEEEHSTRGRANALVKALSAPDPKAALADPRIHEILDLCLECKACKSECPLSVDMAALKSEALAHYYDVHGTPLRSRLFAEIRTVNRIGASIAPVANLVTRARPIRSLMNRTLGISEHRPLPRLSRDTILSRGFQSARSAPEVAAPRGDVVLLTDSFTTYSEPGIGRAAVDLLEAGGWRVHLSGNSCCGRAALSKGLLDRAGSMAGALLDRLTPFAERGVPIVGVEPSCLLTLKDEYSRLLPGDERVAAVARQAMLLPELLLGAIDDGSLRLDPSSEIAGSQIVFHGHCHEKAVVGTGSSRKLLERIPGAEVVELDAGCCGMAGSFGFEREHYEISMQIGGMRLFPAVRNAPAGSTIVASGVSCRQQITHGTGRRAIHPIEALRQAL